MGVHGHTDMFRDENNTFYIPVNSFSSTCRDDSLRYSKALGDYQLWAVQMLDSSGNVPAGLLEGHYHDLGNFEECLEVSKISPFKVQYCVVRIKNLAKIPKSTFYDWETLEFTGGGAPFPKPYLQIGVCVPSSCDLNDLSVHYSQLTRPFNLSVELNGYSCTASDEDERRQLTAMDVVTSAVIAVILVLCIVSTIVDLKYSGCKETGAKLNVARCFSLYRSVLTIFKIDEEDKPLAVLHGVRALSTFCVFVVHHWFFVQIFPLTNFQTVNRYSYSFLSDFLMNGELGVDTFFVMGGLLVTYISLKEADSGKKFNVSRFYMKRLLRIVPPYYMQIMITMSIYKYADTGPLWKHYIYTVVDNCYATWWKHVLFLNNYISPERQCVPPSWYLAADMQLYMIAPLILIPLARRKKIVTHVIIPALIVGANVLMCLLTYVNEYPGTNMADRLRFRPDMFNSEYTPAHARLSPWLIGVMAGFLLQSGTVKITKAQAYSGWIVTTSLVALLEAAVRYQHTEGVGYSLLLATLHNGLHSTVWALFVVWVIIACECGHGGALKKFLAWKGFQPISKLSFTLYLLGIGVQFSLLSSRLTSHAFKPVHLYKDAFGEFLMALLLAPFSSVLFEVPFAKLTRAFSEKGSESQLSANGKRD